MTAPALLKKADLDRMADLANRKQVRVEIEFGGMIIRLAPDHPRAALDDSDEGALDRELEAWRKEHGYS